MAESPVLFFKGVHSARVVFLKLVLKKFTRFCTFCAKANCMQRVTGLGGFFIKSKDPKSLAAWYEKHLGVPFNGTTYAGFKWINENNPALPGSTVFSFFGEDTKYFDPSKGSCMVNFRVKDLDSLLASLKAEGVTVDEKTESYEYGKFGWCMDPEGNKIELWEPVDGIF